MFVELVIISIIILVIALGAFIFCAFAFHQGGYFIGVIPSGILAVYLTIWACNCISMPEEFATEEFYTPILITAENGNKIQFIYAHDDIINVTMTFGAIVPDDKVVKRVTWKRKYNGMIFQDKGVKYFIVPKAEKENKHES